MSKWICGARISPRAVGYWPGFLNWHDLGHDNPFLASLHGLVGRGEGAAGRDRLSTTASSRESEVPRTLEGPLTGRRLLAIGNPRSSLDLARRTSTLPPLLAVELAIASHVPTAQFAFRTNGQLTAHLGLFDSSSAASTMRMSPTSRSIGLGSPQSAQVRKAS